MKTAISLPDAVYAEAERLARRLNKSRSQLYAEAVAAFLRRYDTDALTESFDRVCAEVDTRLDPMVQAATTRVLEHSDW